MVWAAIGAAAIGVVGGALTSKHSSQQAAPAASGGSSGSGFAGLLSDYMTAQQANEMKSATNQAVSMADPFSQSRQMANTQLQSLMQNPGQMQNDPSYQWALQQGMQGVDRSLAAKHQTASGNALTELTQYGQGLASQQYNNRLNQLSNMASQGASPAEAGQLRLQGTQYSQGLMSAAAAGGINSLGSASGIGTALGAAGNAIGGYFSGSGTQPGSSTYSDPNAQVWNSPYANNSFATPQASTSLYDTSSGYSTGADVGGYSGLGYGGSSSFSF